MKLVHNNYETLVNDCYHLQKDLIFLQANAFNSSVCNTA